MHIHNFSAGPATLPNAVIKQAQQELTNWQGRGYSVMEVSHRSNAYMALVQECEQILVRLLNIPDDYAVLFMSLSATAHFGIIPLNIAKSDSRALYLTTGHWSKKAKEHAQPFVQVTDITIDTSQAPHAKQFEHIYPQDFAYAHFCPNETIDGIAWSSRPALPESLPLIGDFSSCILTAPLRIRDYAMIYAGAQKNLGPSGISLVIIRKDLLGKTQTGCPIACNYTLQAAQHSLLHTPNTFGIYLINLVCQWVEQLGGIHHFASRNAARAQRLYDVIDQHSSYHNPIVSSWRSTINIPFHLVGEYQGKDQQFLTATEQRGLLFLQGHRAVGGMRANLYNAVENHSVDALIAFLDSFHPQV